MRVLRPNSVCTGCTDRQFDFTAAVAAALADAFVDHHPGRRRILLSALAFAAFVGRALLIVDQHRHTGNPGQFAWASSISSRGRTRTFVDPPRNIRRVRPGSSEVTTTRETLRIQAVTRGRRARATDRLLSAGHRDGAVVEEFVGDVRTDAMAARIASDPECANVRRRCSARNGPETRTAPSRSTGRPHRPSGWCRRHPDLPRVHDQNHGVTTDPGSHEGAVGDLWNCCADIPNRSMGCVPPTAARSGCAGVPRCPATPAPPEHRDARRVCLPGHGRPRRRRVHRNGRTGGGIPLVLPTIAGAPGAGTGCRATWFRRNPASPRRR